MDHNLNFSKYQTTVFSNGEYFFPDSSLQSVVLKENGDILCQFGNQEAVLINLRQLHSFSCIKTIIYKNPWWFAVVTDQQLIKFQFESVQVTENGVNPSSKLFVREQFVLNLTVDDLKWLVSDNYLVIDRFIIDVNNGEIIQALQSGSVSILQYKEQIAVVYPLQILLLGNEAQTCLLAEAVSCAAVCPFGMVCATEKGEFILVE